jgi:nucleoside-diphosphate-sugar epimerase
MSEILLSGATGFLGSHIRASFSSDRLATVGRANSDDYLCDLSSAVPSFDQYFSMVIHAAGKAHLVPQSTSQKSSFFDVNVNGTSNLLLGLERAKPPRSLVFISSVAVYGKDSGIEIVEDTLLNAREPYGLSKVLAERSIQEWCKKNDVICTILRLPLIAAPNPPGNLKLMIQGIKKGYYFNISGRNAKKSMVLAEDVAKILPGAANVGGIYNLTDGYHPSFSELSSLIAKQLQKNNPVNIPNWLATIMAKSGDILGSKAPINSDKLRKITSNLTFDDTKARNLLGWNPTPVLEGFKLS